MKRQIDTEKIEACIREILVALGDDPTREGLRETPKRVAKMYEEVFAGMTVSNEEMVHLFGTTFEEEEVANSPHQVIIVRDIPIFSYCEHHLALMYNLIGEEIAEIIEKITGSEAIMIKIEGEHSCMTARGIKKPGTSTTTLTYRGNKIEQDASLRQEWLMLLN